MIAPTFMRRTSASADAIGFISTTMTSSAPTERNQPSTNSGEAGRQQGHVESVSQGHAQAAAKLLRRCTQVAQAIIDLRERHLYLAEQLLARLGDDDPLPDAVEQPMADLGLELLDLVRQRRL